MTERDFSRHLNDCRLSVDEVAVISLTALSATPLIVHTATRKKQPPTWFATFFCRRNITINRRMQLIRMQLARHYDRQKRRTNVQLTIGEEQGRRRKQKQKKEKCKKCDPFTWECEVWSVTLTVYSLHVELSICRPPTKLNLRFYRATPC